MHLFCITILLYIYLRKNGKSVRFKVAYSCVTVFFFNDQNQIGILTCIQHVENYTSRVVYVKGKRNNY